MKLYTNENFKLLLSTLMFMLFDLYIIRYDNIVDENTISDLYNDFKNNNINLEDFISENNIYIYTNAIPNLSSLEINEYNLSYKPVNSITLNSSDIYKWTEPETTKTMVVILIKKFDNINYIVPVMLSLDMSYLLSVNRNIELDSFYEFLNDNAEIDKLLTTFSQVTNI